MGTVVHWSWFRVFIVPTSLPKTKSDNLNFIILLPILNI